MSTKDEHNLCLIAEGFPSEVQALQVAEYIFLAYDVGVRKVVPININSCLGQKRWIVCLYSPGDHSKCLSQKNAPLFTSNGIEYSIQLCPADKDRLPADDRWTFIRSYKDVKATATQYPYVQKNSQYPDIKTRTPQYPDVQATYNASSYASGDMGDKSQVKTPSQQRQIRVSIVDGEIAKQNADIIVNSTSANLDLKNGAVSASILAAAGMNLLEECKTKYPRGIKMKEIARTSGHGLDCKEVFHIALCNFTTHNSQKILECIMTKCLTEASNSHHSSIAFPALGTGNLGFPRQVVASTMLGAIDSFQQATPFTTLRDVRIVIYRDMQTIREFQTINSQCQNALAAVNQPSNRTVGSHQHRSFQIPNDNPYSDASALPFTWTRTEKDTLVSLILLKPADFEYQQVEQNFRKTLGNTAATIVSIERIQNCTLYRQYQAKKLHMENQNVGIQNELTLWHGTSVDTTVNINHYGFNRSYYSTYEDVGPLQVVFSFDTTGSMAAALTEVRTRISEMLKRLQDDIPGVTNSVVAHGDYCDAATYITKHVDFTNNVASLVNFVNTVSATWGGDEPEAYEVMLRLVRRDLSWTPGSQRVLVVIGDTYPHPATDPQNQERIDWMAEAKLLADMGVRIYGVQVNNVPNSTQFFQTLVNMTGGQHLQMTQFSTLCDVIMAICFREKGAKFLQSYEMEVRAREGHRPLHHDLEGVFGTLSLAGDVRPKASTRNATAYGEGVYFSVKSEYFANPKNNPPCKTTGNQYIYQCKVLVGYSVKSDPNMRFLPFRAGSIAYDSAADDPNNPGIYVIFSDTQAYPEYIITFR